MKNSTDELIELVAKWGEEKHINDPKAQLNKILEELGEIAHEVNRNNYSSPELIDAIGDTAVTLIIFADLLGLDVRECLECAYEVIKDRKGKLENGSWVKDASNYRDDIEGWGN